MIGDGSRALVGRALSATGAATDAEGPYQRFMQIYQAGLAHLSRLYPDGVKLCEGCEPRERVLLSARTNRSRRPSLCFNTSGSFNILRWFCAVTLSRSGSPIRDTC